MKRAAVVKGVLVFVSLALFFIATTKNSIAMMQFTKEETPVNEKPEYGFLADYGGNQDGYSEPGEETHLDNLMEKLNMKIERLGRLPRKLRSMKMKFHERRAHYGILILTDKEFNCINKVNKIYISTENIIKEKGKDIFSGYLLKYDEKLKLKSVWTLNNVPIGEVDKWEELIVKGIDINYYEAMSKRKADTRRAKKAAATPSKGTRRRKKKAAK